MSIHELSQKWKWLMLGTQRTKSSAKWIGITMAMLGVMLAFAAAMVGAEQTNW